MNKTGQCECSSEETTGHLSVNCCNICGYPIKGETCRIMPPASDCSAVKITVEDLDACWLHYKSYLVDILNGDYSLSQAQEDIRGLIGSDYDTRKQNTEHQSPTKAVD